MPYKIRPKQKLYLDVAKAKKEDINRWKWGVSIELKAGESIETLKIRATSFRYRLAMDTLRTAKRALNSPKPSYRNVLGRAYYAMYNAMRAVVYASFGGDDHEDHTKLAKEIPPDFPDRLDWQAVLRDARLERNRADYDPFPLSDASFKSSAVGAVDDALRLAVTVKSYLASKGISV